MCNPGMRGLGGWCDRQDGRGTKLMLVDGFGVWGIWFMHVKVGWSRLRS